MQPTTRDLAQEQVNVSFQRVTGSDPHQIARAISAIAEDGLDGVALMAPEAPQVRDATAHLPEHGVEVVQFISWRRKADGSDFVGVDNRAAGATAGQIMGRFSGARTGEVIIFADAMNSRDRLDRRPGLDRVLSRDFPGLTALPSLETRGDAERTHAVIAQNPGHPVRSALRRPRARGDGREPPASREEIRIEILLRENLGSSAATWAGEARS